ncbi:L-Fucosyltransferase [Caenorhabditis elegans]|uniref:L-Fucosyltransferase n=1 Tax=Caenorhabditis elegans TaxID=6239 RepID=O44669_CAEEL|nr:L-Fucosyltransferase [Caenorhabditis elegans]CCD64460.1 L-Fucosyltransferase [Caenorhabditis elegans]|eukprot:NP_503240.2 Uncharacterized protein CELE_C14C6.3 [Caenorhabditis elegans]
MAVVIKTLRSPVFCFAIIISVIIVATKLQFNNSSGPQTTLLEPKRYLSSRMAPAARLGNHIFELAAVLGIARVLNRTATFFIEDDFYREMLENTSEAIPGLVNQFELVNGTVPSPTKTTKLNTRCCIFVDPLILENVNDQYLHLDGLFYQAWKYFPSMRDELSGYLKKSKKNYWLPKPDNDTFVTCAHVRRSDFTSNGFAASESTFVRSALDFIQDKENGEKLKNTIVLFGDDPKFMRNIFNNTSLSDQQDSQILNTTYFVSQNSPSDDLVYAKDVCDVVLISAPHSTFGWWIGYFSKGDKVYYMDIRETNDWVYRVGELNPYDYFMPHWIPLKFASNNSTIVESLK